VQSQRNFLIAIVLSMVVLFGWGALSERFFPTAAPVKPAATAAVTATGTSVPGSAPAAAIKRDRTALLATGPRVAIRNAKLAGSINLTGARIDDLVLSAYGQTISKGAPPVRLLSPEGAADAYYAGFGWSGNGIDLPGPQTVWQADGTALTPGKPVTLTWTNAAGQTFAAKLAIDDAYLFTVTQTIANRGAAPVAARPYGFIARDGISADKSSWNAHVGPIGVFDNKANYSINWKDLDEAGSTGTRFSSPGGWLGFGDHYWLTALAPAGSGTIDAGFRASGKTYQADYAGTPITVGPGQSASATTRLFAGAKELAALDGYETSAGIPLFGKAIDWGWYEIIEKPIFKYLSWLFKLTGNFGVAIILLTLTVRLLMFPIANKQFASMAATKAIQPKMKALQERYKDDKPKLQQETMALFKAEKINPLAGCAPILLQVPIFFALYKVLILSTEMRHQPFFGWIKDLSAPDPLTPVNLFGLLPFQPTGFLAIGVLAIMLGIRQFMQFKLNPQPADPTQAQMFKIMPWVMMFIMAPFAAGLLIYYIATNLFTMAQQKLLYMRHPGLSTDPAKA